MTVKELMEILKQYQGTDKVSFLEGILKIVSKENDVSFIDEDRTENECRLVIEDEPKLYEVCPQNNRRRQCKQ